MRIAPGPLDKADLIIGLLLLMQQPIWQTLDTESHIDIIRDLFELDRAQAEILVQATRRRISL